MRTDGQPDSPGQRERKEGSGAATRRWRGDPDTVVQSEAEAMLAYVRAYFHD